VNRVLIAGAGAEVDLGFECGINFTYDTFYRKKLNLYDALSKFYNPRISSEDAFLAPNQYRSEFLFNSKGHAFIDLVASIYEKDPVFIGKIAPGLFKENTKDGNKFNTANLDKKQLDKLFNLLIIESDSTDDVLRQQEIMKHVPSDSHFGVLEGYYSSLLNFEHALPSFWKLINFYWSAYFSIALPITDRLYRNNSEEYRLNRYDFVLDNLDQVIGDSFEPDFVDSAVSQGCYYSALTGLFDGVITTNYTPFCEHVVNHAHDAVVWLSGNLSEFERLDSLEFESYVDKAIPDNVFVFPYLMCQAPVKPIISRSQILDFNKAISFLDAADEIVVLGYSFCDEDSHIASMVGETLRSDASKKMTFFNYCKNEQPDLIKKLRLPPDFDSRRLEIVNIENYKSSTFIEKTKRWAGQ
jgi:hypothetical protein